MDDRQWQLSERMKNIEMTLNEINRRLTFLDTVQIPFIYQKLKTVEKEMLRRKVTEIHKARIEQAVHTEEEVSHRAREPIQTAQMSETEGRRAEEIIPSKEERKEPREKVTNGQTDLWVEEHGEGEQEKVVYGYEDDREKEPGEVGYTEEELIGEEPGMEPSEKILQEERGPAVKPSGEDVVKVVQEDIKVAEISKDAELYKQARGTPRFTPVSRREHAHARGFQPPVIPTGQMGFPPWPPEPHAKVRPDADEIASRWEYNIGGKWFLRIGIFLVCLGFFIWGYFIRTLTDEEKAALFFVCGGFLVIVGEYIYTYQKRFFEKSLISYGVWLILGGLQIMYIGAWRTHSVYELAGFEDFIALILGIVAVNVILSIRHRHLLMNIQYLTHFYLVCIGVNQEYAASDPYFTILFLMGTSLIFLTDSLFKKSDNAVFTLGYSSVVLFILLWETDGLMPMVLGGYVIILFFISYVYRAVDTIFGIGKVPDFFWGSLLLLSYLHLLNFLLISEFDQLLPALFALATLGMVFTYYLPLLPHGAKGYRFATDIEFYFIVGVFFFIFFTISPDVLLLPTLIIVGVVIGVINLLYQEVWEIPPLLGKKEYILIGPRKDTLFLMDNRTRYHMFLLLFTAITLLGIIVMDADGFQQGSYLLGFLSMALVLSIIEYCRSDEDAIQELQEPVFGMNGELDHMKLSIDSRKMDRSLNLHLNGLLVTFTILIIVLSIDFNPYLLFPYFTYLVAVIFLNWEFSRALSIQLQYHAKEEEGKGIQGLEGMEGVRNALKRSWKRTDEVDHQKVILLWTGLVTMFAGLMMMDLAIQFFIIFNILVIIIQMEGKLVRQNAFLLRSKKDSMDFPGLYNTTDGFLLYIPFIPLILANVFDLPVIGVYGPYVFLIPILIMDRYLFPKNSISLPLHVLSLGVIGLLSSPDFYSGFVFLLAAGMVSIYDYKEIRKNPQLSYIMPVIFLYIARGIVGIQGNDILDNGYPTPLPATIEILGIGIFLYLTWEIIKKHPKWNGGPDREPYDVHLELFALFFLLPVTNPQYHVGFLLIPFGILYFSLRLNSPLENLISFYIASFAVWDLMDVFLAQRGQIYSLIIMMSIFIAMNMILEYVKFGNEASMIMLGFSTLNLLSLTAFVYDGGISTTLSWIILSVILIGVGFLQETRYHRWTGIFVASLTAAKILIYDMEFEPIRIRVISLIITGSILLIISYIYFRYRERIIKKKVTKPLEMQ